MISDDVKELRMHIEFAPEDTNASIVRHDQLGRILDRLERYEKALQLIDSSARTANQFRGERDTNTAFDLCGVLGRFAREALEEK